MITTRQIVEWIAWTCHGVVQRDGTGKLTRALLRAQLLSIKKQNQAEGRLVDCRVRITYEKKTIHETVVNFNSKNQAKSKKRIMEKVR